MKTFRMSLARRHATQKKLEEYLGYDPEKVRYSESKNRLKMKIITIEGLLSDKGENEEKQATERIVWVIGILTLFEIVSQFLPLFSDNITYIIRIGFLILFLPSLVLLWFYTSYMTRRKKKSATRIKKQNNLQKQKEIMQSFMHQLQTSKQMDLMQLSEEYIEEQIHWIKNQLNNIEGN